MTYRNGEAMGKTDYQDLESTPEQVPHHQGARRQRRAPRPAAQGRPVPAGGPSERGPTAPCGADGAARPTVAGVHTTVADNPAEHRFEIRADGALAGFAAYRSGQREYVFTHTEIDPAYEGKGLGSVLVRGALDALRSRGLGAVPVCPFVLRFVRRHEDYLDLVPARDRDRLGLPADAPAEGSHPGS